jgi:hypothetical protein
MALKPLSEQSGKKKPPLTTYTTKIVESLKKTYGTGPNISIKERIFDEDESWININYVEGFQKSLFRIGLTVRNDNVIVLFVNRNKKGNSNIETKLQGKILERVELPYEDNSIKTIIAKAVEIFGKE